MWETARKNGKNTKKKKALGEKTDRKLKPIQNEAWGKLNLGRQNEEVHVQHIVFKAKISLRN